MMRDDDHPPDTAVQPQRPTSTPPSVKVTREVGFVVIVVSVLVCASVMRGLDKLSGETYAIVLSGTLIMAAALQGGSGMKALETLLLKR